MDYNKENLEENVEKGYFGLKIAYNCIKITNRHLMDKFWDIVEALEYPIIYLNSKAELQYCINTGLISKERLEKEKQPIVVMFHEESFFKDISKLDVPCLFSTIDAKIGVDTKKLTRYVLSNMTLEMKFEIKPQFLEGLTREKKIETVFKD